MSVAFYSPHLPWYVSPRDKKRFRNILLASVTLFFFFSVVIPFITLPEPEEDKVIEIPPRLVQLITEQKKPPPPAPKSPRKRDGEKVVQKEETPKPKPKPKPKPQSQKTVENTQKVAPKPKQSPKPSQAVELAAARKKAASVGLLAVSDSLSDLRDSQLVAQLGKTPTARSGSGSQSATGGSTSGGVPSRIVAGVGAGSGGVNSNGLARTTGGTAFSGRGTSNVSSSSANAVSAGSSQGGSGSSGKGKRSFESVKRTINQSKGAIYNIYNRELRKNPLLEGVILVELTIAPSGEITGLKLVSSELQSPDLERKLLARLKLINFGAKDVEVFVTRLPFEFFPA